MVESGPASGFWGAAELGQRLAEPNILALDIGGTTAKCSLIEDGPRSPGGTGEVEWFDLIYHERESTRGIPA